MRALVLSFFGIVLLFLVLRDSWDLFPWGLELSLAQLIILPLLLIWFWRFRFANHRMPRTLLLVAVVAALVGFVFSRGVSRNGKVTLLVSRLSEDEFEVKERVLREKLNAVLATEAHLSSSQYNRKFEKHSEIVNHVAGPALVLWGKLRWLRISLLEHASDDDTGIKVWGLQFVSGVPVFGLSLEPQNETARYLGLLTAGKFRNDSDTATALAPKELQLKEAAFLQAPWTSQAHRAVAFLELGNLHVRELLRDVSYDFGTARCALDAYNRGLKVLKPTDNPEAYAALLNNSALLSYMQGVLEGRADLKKLAIKRLHLARQFISKPNLYGTKNHAAKVAHKNLKPIKHSMHSQRVKSRKHKSQKLRKRAKLEREAKAPRHKRKHNHSSAA